MGLIHFFHSILEIIIMKQYLLEGVLKTKKKKLSKERIMNNEN